MSRFAHMRKLMLPLVIVIAIVAVAVPTCRMVGCDMNMGAMGFMLMTGSSLSAPCPGTWEFSSAPLSNLPSSPNALLLTLTAALVAAVVLFAPQVTSRPALVRASNPPPPPEDPRGERFRV